MNNKGADLTAPVCSQTPKRRIFASRPIFSKLLFAVRMVNTDINIYFMQMALTNLIRPILKETCNCAIYGRTCIRYAVVKYNYKYVVYLSDLYMLHSVCNNSKLRRFVCTFVALHGLILRVISLQTL